MNLNDQIILVQRTAAENAVIENLKKIGLHTPPDNTTLPEYPWPDPKSEDLKQEDFNLVWECIKAWDINVPEVYEGYCGATGNHVMSILFAAGKRNISDYTN